MIVLPGFYKRWQEYEAMEKQPLKITLKLRQGAQIAGYDPLLLDGVLAWCMVHELTLGQGVPQSEEGYLLPTPLQCLWRDAEGFPLWATTPAHPEGASTKDVSYRHKKHPSGRFVKGRKGRFNISPSDGRFMERRVPVPTEIADRWTIRCVGNAIEVGRLLEYLRAVGKERARGFGAVDHWLIEPDEREWRLVENFALARTIPEGCVASLLNADQPQGYPSLVGWTPPYWLPGLFAPGWRVGTQVEVDWYEAV